MTVATFVAAESCNNFWYVINANTNCFFNMLQGKYKTKEKNNKENISILHDLCWPRYFDLPFIQQL